MEAGSSHVRVSGAKSFVDRVRAVGTSVSIENAHQTFMGYLPLTVFNAMGAAITDTVSLSTESVYVTIPVLPVKWVDVIIDQTNAGEPMSGFMVTDIIPERQRVQIVGSEEDLEGIDAIVVAGLNMQNATADVVQVLSLSALLPMTDPPITLRAGTPDGITVTVRIERMISKEIGIPVEDILVSGTLLQYFFPDEAPVIVWARGRESLVNDIGVRDLRPQISLSGYAPGTYMIPLEFPAKPDEVYITNTDVSVLVTILAADD
jgi:YbbR domain-containing protein